MFPNYKRDFSNVTQKRKSCERYTKVSITLPDTGKLL